MKTSVEASQQIAAALMKGNVVAITGAGCSTPSGIGDYRDENGEWKRRQPVQHKDFVEDLAWRQRYWARSQVGYPEFLRAEPNRAHQLLAEWERQGWLRGIITQNVDRLHQRAGSESVIDLHGRLDRVICLACQSTSPRSELQGYLERVNPEISELSQTAVMAPDGDADLATEDYSDFRIPDCDSCGGTLKPDVVFYGDSVPKSVVDQAYDWISNASSVLVIGSSLMVFSSFRFVRRAAELEIPVYAINRGKTRGDDLFVQKMDEECVSAMESISEHV